LEVTVSYGGAVAGGTGRAAATAPRASSSAQDGALPPGDGAAAPGAASLAKRGRPRGVGIRAQAVSPGAVIGEGEAAAPQVGQAYLLS